VKHNALYGEPFADWLALEQHLQRWLEEVANVRVHGTTGQVPQGHYEAAERAQMRPYFSPVCLAPTGIAGEPRQVDKTGLISFQSNKYSVPRAYQSSRVNVLASPDGQLHIYALPGGECIARHPLSHGKGAIVKNGDHYRDKAQQVADLEADIQATLGKDLGQRLCHQLRQTDPPQYKDKLRGLKRHLHRLQAVPEAQLAYLADKEGLKVGTLLDYLSAWEANPERMAQWGQEEVTSTPAAPPPVNGSLSAYGYLTQSPDSEVAHELP